MKVFISQPMRGKTEEEIIQQREEVSKYIRKIFNKEDITILDSFVKLYDKNIPSLWYLGRSIEILSEADIVYLAPGWTKARGCLIEELAAAAYGITIIDGEKILDKEN